MRRLRFLATCICLGALAMAGGASKAFAASVPNIIVHQDLTSVPLKGHVLILRDKDHHVSLDDIVSGKEDANFYPKYNTIAFGYTDDTIWLKFTVQRDRVWPKSLFLRFQPNYIDHIDVYVPRTAAPASGADFIRVGLGDHASDRQRPLFATFQATDLHPPDVDAFTIYVSVRTSSSMILSGTLASEASISRAITKSSVGYGISIAFFVTIAGLHLYTWARARQPMRLWFTGFLLSLAALTYGSSGLIESTSQPGGIFVSDYVTELAVLGSYFCGLGFAMSQTGTKARLPRLHLVSLAGLAVFFAGGLLTLFGLYSWVIKPDLVIVNVALIVYAWNNIGLALRHEVGCAVAAVAYGIYALILFPYHTALLGFVTMTPIIVGISSLGNMTFAVLMTVSLMQRAFAAERSRKESEDLRIALRAERTATALVEIRTSELVAEKEKVERALAHEQAARAEQLRFVDVVTHQYQTPLAIIRSSITAIRYTLSPHDDANRQRVQQIQAAVRQLVEIMDVSLQRSRMMGGVTKVNLQRVPLVSTLNGFLARSQKLLSGHRLLSSFEGIVDKDFAMIDFDMVAIALSNLLDNAAKFSAPDADIGIRFSRQDASLIVTVADEGIGIPPQEMERVSQRYFRASNAGHISGTGLGLHIVSQVAAAHRGSFTIGPRPGQGTLARLAIPAFDAAAD